MDNNFDLFKRACTFALFLALTQLSWAQELLKVADWDKSTGFIQMKPNSYIEPMTFFARFGKDLGLGESDEMVLLRKEEDKIGMTHYRFQQKHKGFLVEHAVVNVHAKGGYVVSANGSCVENMAQNKANLRSEASALESALHFLGKKLYSWENLPQVVSTPDTLQKKGIWESPEDSIMANKDRREEDITATLPKGEVVYTMRDNSVTVNRENKVLAYRFPIYFYAEDSHLDGAYVYVDAKTGEIVKSSSLVHNCNGQWAQTNQPHYDGADGSGYNLYIKTQGWVHQYCQWVWSWQCLCFIWVCNCTHRSWDLDDNCLGFEIKTTNQNGSLISINSSCSGAVPMWSNAYSDYTTAHWAAKNAYNYFLYNHGLNGYNGSGSGVLEIRMVPGFANAGAIPGVSRLEIGYNSTYNGQSNITFATLDALGHEYTHKVIESNLGAVPLAGEAGAIYEGFADIFATMSEFEKLGNNANYWIGEDIDHNPNTPNLRDMSNPNAFLQPDTYNGTYWDPNNYDPHTNSGVQDFWFYLLAEGGSGTNDHNNAYCVQGIGRTAAAAITYASMAYLNSNSSYADSRFYSILSAQNLYGINSFEAQQTAASWYAVGVYGNNAVSFNANNNFLCAGGTVNFTGTISGTTTAPYTILLCNTVGNVVATTTSNSTNYSINYTPTTSGDYYVVVYDSASPVHIIYYEKCPIHVDLFGNSSLTINATSTGATNCLDDNMLFQANISNGLNPLTYSWNIGGQIANTNPTQMNLLAGNYPISLQVTTANGCVANASTNIIVDPDFCGNPAFNPVVNGNLITLNAADNIAASDWYVYDNAWNPLNIYPVGTTNLNLAGGDYIVKHTMYNCEGSRCDSVYYNISTCDPLQVSLTGNNPVCSGTSTTYTANVTGGNGGYTYLWNVAGQTGSSITVSPTVNKTYKVYVTAPHSCATVMASINVVVNPLPTAAIAGPTPTTFCLGTALNANTGAGLNYQWYLGQNLIAGATNSSYIPTAPGNHKVIVTDANGCSKTSAWTNVTLLAAPPANAGADKTICAGASTKIGTIGNNAYTYTWSPTTALATPYKDTTKSITNITRTYILTVNNPATGCSKKDTVKVTVNPLPTTLIISLNGANPFCQGSGTTLSVSNITPNINYQWWRSTTAVTNNNAANTTYPPILSGNHKVIATDANGCVKASGWTGVTVNPLPTALAGPDKTICAGSPVAIGNTNNVAWSYDWSPGIGLSDSAASNPTAFPSDTTQYILIVKNNTTQCAKKDTINVLTKPLPLAPDIELTNPLLPGEDTLIFCEGNTTALAGTALGYSSFYWYRNGIYFVYSSGSTVSNLALAPAGENFTAKTKAANGCYSLPSDTIFVQKLPAPQPLITPAGTNNLIEFCANGTNIAAGTLYASAPIGAPNVNGYTWYSGGAGNIVAGMLDSLGVNIPCPGSLYYRVEAHYANGCSRKSGVKIVKCNPTCKIGQEKGGEAIILAEENMFIYPNPAQDILYIELQGSKSDKGTLILCNLLGQEIARQDVLMESGAIKVSFEMTKLAAGVYVISYISETAHLSQKVMKE